MPNLSPPDPTPRFPSGLAAEAFAPGLPDPGSQNLNPGSRILDPGTCLNGYGGDAWSVARAPVQILDGLP